jgi:hypothetical protein
MEQELPSSSQFYQWFNIEVDDEFTPTLSCESEELQSTSFPLRNPNGTSDIEHIPNIQKQVDALRLIENHKPYKNGTVDFDLDAALLADEYTRLKKITEHDNKDIGNNEVKLDMQDKELEAIIASIAELCDLNVTVQKDETNVNRHFHDARKSCVDDATYGYGFGDVPPYYDIRETKFEIDTETIASQMDEEYDEALRHELENLKAEINMEEEKSKTIQQELLSTRNHYNYLKRYITTANEEGEPCNTPNDIQNVEKISLSETTRPDLNSCLTKRPPILGPRAASTTPRPENIPQHVDLSASRSISSSCCIPCSRNRLVDSVDNDNNHNYTR